MSQSLLGCIEQSAATGAPVTLEGADHLFEARELVANGLAMIEVGSSGQAILVGDDPESRPFTVILVDIYAHELEER